MKFSLIVCTYMRPRALTDLLASVNLQTNYPDQIIIVDGSTNDETKEALAKKEYKNLFYYKVSEKERGISLQRNFGMAKVSNDMKIVCFLDDDIILTPDYFFKLINTYQKFPDAGGVGGYIINKEKWKVLSPEEKPKFNEHEIDGWVKKLSSRKIFLKKLGLLPNERPCIMPKSSNGFPVSSFPPNNQIFKVEYFLGGVSSFTKEVLDTIKFSGYFQGYGLYEDLDYCLRVSKGYSLYVNTAAKLYHYHEPGGRPNKFNYGKMVVRNGWYVWRTKYRKPKLLYRIKWNTVALVLICIRFSNVFNTSKKKEAFQESLGRLIGLLSLIINKPKYY